MIHPSKFKILKKRFMTLLEMLIGMALTMALLTTLTFFYQMIDQLNTASEKAQKEIFHVQYAENRLSQVLTEAIAEKQKNHLYFYTSGDLGGLFATGSPSLVFQYETGTDLDDSRAVTALGRLFLDKQNRLSLATWPDPTDERPDAINLSIADKKTSKAKVEVLLENVSSLRFQFYVAPDRDRSLLNQKNSPAPEEKDKTKDDPKQNDGKTKKTNTKADGDATKKDDAKSTPHRAGELPKEQKQLETPKTGTEPNATNEDANVLNEPELKGVWVPTWDRKYEQLPAMMKIEIQQFGKDKPLIFAFPFLKSKKVIVYEQ